MNVLFTKRRSIIAPTARGNYPIHPIGLIVRHLLFFSGALIRKNTVYELLSFRRTKGT